MPYKSKSQLPVKTGNEIKVLFMTTWNTACGIATYSANLIEELEKDNRIKVEVFTNSKSFGDLVRLAKASDADIIHIQHEFGISLGADAFISIVSKFKYMGKRVIITSHTEDDMFNALLDGVADCIILHNDAKDMANRNTFSYFEKIPHGIPTVTFSEPKSFYREKYDIPLDAFVIGTCGFLAKNSIQEVMAHLVLLAAKHKSIFINLVTSTHSQDKHGKFTESIKQGMINMAKAKGFEDRIFVGTEFTPVEEFRERIYTMDIGFSFADLTLSSNSGAAADMVACGIPVITNDAIHFSHLKDFITTVPEASSEALVKKIEEVYDTPEILPELQQKIKALENLSYAAVAKKHIVIYDKVLFGSKEAVDAPLTKDKPIQVIIPSNLWGLLLIWPKLHTLVVAGYKLELITQNDGLTDISMLQFVLGGIANISFDDVGMVKDPHLFKITSKQVAQKISVDLESYLTSGNTYDNLFPDIGPIYDFPVTLGDYAIKAAKKLVNDITGMIAVFSLTPQVLPHISEYIAELPPGTHIILMASPMNRYLIEDAEKQCNDYMGDITVVVEDTRTRWAIVREVNTIITGLDEVAAYCLLKELLCTVITTEEYQVKLIEHFNNNTSVEHIIKHNAPEVSNA